LSLRTSLRSFALLAASDVARLWLEFRWFLLAGFLLSLLLLAAISWGCLGKRDSKKINIDLRLADYLGAVPRTLARDPPAASAMPASQDGITMQQAQALIRDAEARITDVVLAFRTEMLQLMSADRVVERSSQRKGPAQPAPNKRSGWLFFLQAKKETRNWSVQTVQRTASRKVQTDPQTPKPVTVDVQTDDPVVPAEPMAMEVQTDPVVCDVQSDPAPIPGTYVSGPLDSDSEDEDMLPVRAFPIAITQENKEREGRRKRHRRDDEPLTKELKENILKNIQQADTIADLTREVEQLKETVEAQKKKVLTEEEQQLKIHELIRKLAREEWDARHKPKLEVLEDRGLSDKEKLMSRSQLLRHLQQEERAAWMQAQEEQGKAFTCQQCGKRTAGGDKEHMCFQSRYRGPQRRKNGVWVRDQMYVTQAGRGGVQVGVRPVVDQDRLQREYQQMTQALQQQHFFGSQAAPPNAPDVPVASATAPPPPPPAGFSQQQPIQVEPRQDTQAQVGVVQQSHPACFLQQGVPIATYG
jgi:hypothetical protein